MNTLENYLAIFRAWAGSNKVSVVDAITYTVDTLAALAHVPASITTIILPILEGIILGTTNNPAVPSADGNGTTPAGPAMTPLQAVSVAIQAATAVAAQMNLNPIEKTVDEAVGEIAKIL